jgi:hypothetical protein
VKAAYI